MVRFGQLVLGPAGSGKSTYIGELYKHCLDQHRVVHCVNLDPAADNFSYPVAVDVRDLISVDDVLSEFALGPNGALLFCIEYLLQHLDWIDDQISESFGDDDYLLFDLPGQIELYTHSPLVPALVAHLERALDFRLAAVFTVDAGFVLPAKSGGDPSRLVGAAVSALAAMVSLECPHINVLTKMDLMKGADEDEMEYACGVDVLRMLERSRNSKFDGIVRKKFWNLNNAMANLLEDFNMVNFVTLDITDPDSINDLLLQVDIALQYDEVLDTRRVSDDEEEYGGDGSGA